MADATTRLTISAQVKGMSDAVKDSNKLKDSLEGIGKSSNKAGSGIKSVLRGLRKELRDSIKDSEAMGHAYEAQGKQLKRLQKEYDLLAGAIKKTRKEKQEDKKEDAKAAKQPSFVGRVANFFRGGRGSGGGGGGGGSNSGGSQGFAGDGSRGSFQQGLLQAITPQAFIQRGPGAFSQAAGNVVGSTLRNVGSAGMTLLGGGLSGSQAAVSALSQLGHYGGIAAGGLQMQLGAAQQEASAQRSFQSLLPFVRSGYSSSAISDFNDLGAFAGKIGRRQGGLSRNESAATIARMAAVGGGVASSYGDQEIGQALSAQAGLGVDVGVAGIMNRGDQLGLSRSSTGNSFPRAIADALDLKLKGSEIPKYLSSIAGNIEGITTTGIKVDAGERGSLSRLLRAQSDMTGQRASEVAGGISGTLNSVAQQGAQNSGEFLLLQGAGYDPKKPSSYYAARERLDNASPEERARIVASAQASARRGLRGLGRREKGAVYQKIAAQMGENLSYGEAIKESQAALTPDRLASALKPPDVHAAMVAVKQMGESNTFQSSKAGASMADSEKATGQAVLPNMLQMDARAKQTLSGLAPLGEAFLDLAADMSKLGARLTGFILNGSFSDNVRSQ